MGNILGVSPPATPPPPQPITLPLFCANITANFTLWNTLESISMLPLVNGNSMMFIILNVAVRMFGVKVFQVLGPLCRTVSVTRRALYLHLTELTKVTGRQGMVQVLEEEGPYICGEQYTLADISMVAPPPLSPCTRCPSWRGWRWPAGGHPLYRPTSHWSADTGTAFSRGRCFGFYEQNKLQRLVREGYKASRMGGDYQAKVDRAGAQVDRWKKEHPWFNAFYEGQD